MPETSEHADLIHLFCRHPELAARLAKLHAGVDLPGEYTFEVINPHYRLKFESDVVIRVRDANGVVVLAIIVEIQRAVDPGKKESWPVYMWAERARSHCEVVVLVIAPRKHVATWARQPIQNGASVTQVTVLGADEFPRITDRAEARADLPFAALAAALRIKDPDRTPVQYAAYLALRGLPRTDALLYISLIFSELDHPVLLALLEEIMDIRSDDEEDDGIPVPGFGQAFWEAMLKGRSEGLTEGRSEGLTEGRSEGALLAKREVLLRFLDQRGLPTDAVTRLLINTCVDQHQLDRWLDRVLVIREARELFDL